MGGPDFDEVLELHNRITKVQLAHDYSTNDFVYPPIFSWERSAVGDGVQNGEIFKRLTGSHYGMYVHLPFCRSRCRFCRVAMRISADKQECESYSELVREEMRLYSPYVSSMKLRGVYIGGGTPTLFNLERLMEGVEKNFARDQHFYLNIESTPESLDDEKIAELKRIGTTRLLIGVQTFDPALLKDIGRPVDQLEMFRRAYGKAREAGIGYINVEFIAGLPGQDEKSLSSDLEKVIAMKPDSIHVYPFKMTPLTVYGQDGTKPVTKWRVRQLWNLASRIMEYNGYHNWGNDNALVPGARNPNLSSRTHPEFGPSQANLAIGASAVGYYSLSGRNDFGTYNFASRNMMDLGSYKERISKGLLPVERFARLDDPDEQIRMIAIQCCRFGHLSDTIMAKRGVPISCEILLKKFPEEMAYLIKVGFAVVSHDRRRISFNRAWRLKHTKMFYSEKVLERCRSLIESGRLCGG